MNAWCPTCGVPPERPCIDQTGEDRPEIHYKRRTAGVADYLDLPPWPTFRYVLAVPCPVCFRASGEACHERGEPSGLHYGRRHLAEDILNDTRYGADWAEALADFLDGLLEPWTP